MGQDNHRELILSAGRALLLDPRPSAPDPGVMTKTELEHQIVVHQARCAECGKRSMCTHCSYQTDCGALCQRCLPPHYILHQLENERTVGTFNYIPYDLAWASLAKPK